MSLEKITTQQMDAKGVCAAPDVLSGTPAQNKAVFDRMVRELIAPAYNAAVDAVNALEETESGIEAAEALRVAAEELRAAAETARAEAESGRAEAEQQRQDAETQRQDLESGYVARSENGAKASESWAVGGTGTREGEDTNNAKYWSEQAAAAAGGGVTSFKGRTGSVIPASGDYTAEMVGAYSKEETDTLLQNKASAGFGFGGETLLNISVSDASESYESFCAKVDAVLATMRDSSVKMISAYPPEIYGSGTPTCILYKHSNDYAGLYSVSSYNEAPFGFRMIKRKIYSSDPTGKWQPFEWFNPPMTLGVEYRTTERYMGDPVYVKLVDCGSVVDGKTIDLGLSNPAIITDAVVILQNSPGPAFYTSTGLGNFGFSYFIDYYYGTPITCAITFHVGASLNDKPSHGYVTIKYVKRK